MSMKIFIPAFDTGDITDIMKDVQEEDIDNSNAEIPTFVLWRERILIAARRYEIHKISDLKVGTDKEENKFIIIDRCSKTSKNEIICVLRKHRLVAVKRSLAVPDLFSDSSCCIQFTKESFFLLKLLGINNKTLTFK